MTPRSRCVGSCSPLTTRTRISAARLGSAGLGHVRLQEAGEGAHGAVVRGVGGKNPGELAVIPSPCHSSGKSRC